MPPLNVNTSIVDLLKSRGQASDFGSRGQLAGQFGIKNYVGSAEQNVSLINYLKNAGQQPTQTTVKTPAPVTPGVVMPGTPSNSGTGTGFLSLPDLNKLLGIGAQPNTAFNPDNPNTPEGQDLAGFQANRQALYNSTNQPIKDIYRGQMEQELGANAKEAADRTKALQTSLALRGILGNSSEAADKLQQHSVDEEKIASAIRDKYTLLSAGLDAQTTQRLVADIDNRRATLVAAKKAELDQYNENRNFALSQLKEFNDTEYKRQQLELDKQKADVDAKYKSGQLTVDQYNAESTRIKAESGALLDKANAAKAYRESEGAAGGYKFSNDDVGKLINSGLSQQDVANIQADLKAHGADEVLKGLPANQQSIVRDVLAGGNQKQFLTKDYIKNLYTDQQLKDEAYKAGFKSGGVFGLGQGADTEAYLNHMNDLIGQYRSAGYTDADILKLMK